MLYSTLLMCNVIYLLDSLFSCHHKVLILCTDEEHATCEVLVMVTDQLYSYFRRLQSMNTNNYLNRDNNTVTSSH